MQRRAFLFAPLSLLAIATDASARGGHGGGGGRGGRGHGSKGGGAIGGLLAAGGAILYGLYGAVFGRRSQKKRMSPPGGGPDSGMVSADDAGKAAEAWRQSVARHEARYPKRRRRKR